ncbi:putative membrane protein [Alteromonas macleodii]|uniref:Membrane protein n=1 Tax=Alteromonas macleodii TaxID=28108 RepID=A0AB36FLJ2_ALTMA|nr:putative membrane protein [Alteromonas macleodii]OES25569.1 putative membrane protein [Alteromonas macleodii]OES25965.1 putative membrane protein [Alteromonas macleodii]
MNCTVFGAGISFIAITATSKPLISGIVNVIGLALGVLLN